MINKSNCWRRCQQNMSRILSRGHFRGPFSFCCYFGFCSFFNDAAAGIFIFLFIENLIKIPRLRWRRYLKASRALTSGLLYMFFSQLHDSSIFMEKCQAQEEEHKESIPVNKLHHRIFTHKKGSKVKRHVAYAYYCSDLNDFCVRILYVCVTQNVMRQRCKEEKAYFCLWRTFQMLGELRRIRFF